MRDTYLIITPGSHVEACVKEQFNTSAQRAYATCFALGVSWGDACNRFLIMSWQRQIVVRWSRTMQPRTVSVDLWLLSCRIFCFPGKYVRDALLLALLAKSKLPAGTTNNNAKSAAEHSHVVSCESQPETVAMLALFCDTL